MTDRGLRAQHKMIERHLVKVLRAQYFQINVLARDRSRTELNTQRFWKYPGKW